ncbi:Apolipoprotein A-IV [Manis javanica]|nr:Apolipoprotein A-IV [Manis javanica]
MAFKDMDDLQKRLVLFVKGINTNLAQESEELEEDIQQMAEEVETLVLHHARKFVQIMVVLEEKRSKKKQDTRVLSPG